DGADADNEFFDRVVRSEEQQITDRQPLAVAAETATRMAEIDARHFERVAFDVFPHIHLRPVAQWKHSHVFAGIDPGVVQVPDFGLLVLWIPLTKAVAKAEKALLRAGLFLVTSGAADAAVEAKLLDRRQQGGNLQTIAADFARRRHGNPFGDGILDVADDEF